MNNVNDLIGQPFDLQAKNGFNCYSLCKEVCRRGGVLLPDRQPVEELSDRSDAINSGKVDYIKLEKPEPFCLATFKMHPKFVTHIGVVLEDCQHFIHILKKKAVIVERLDSPRWQKRLDGYYGYIGQQPSTD